MKSSLLVLAFVGCAREVTPLPEAETIAPDASVLVDRRVNDVIVGDTSVIWSHSGFPCSLEFGCPEGPTVTAYDRTAQHVSTWIDGGIGTPQLAGNEAELYYVNGERVEERSVWRKDHIGSTAISAARANVTGPTVDAGAVYWAEADEPAAAWAIRRAARAGNGSDATTIAIANAGADQLTYSGGYLWWVELHGHWLTRVSVSGGEPERLLSDVSAIGTSNGGGVYVGRIRESINTSDWILEIGHVDAAGTFVALTTQTTAMKTPRYIVSSDGFVFWTLGDGTIYYLPEVGGQVEAIAAGADAGDVFAVFPDKILVAFNRHGFREVPR